MGADLLDQVQQVRADDDGRPLARALQDRVLHAPDADGVQAGERLVKVDHPGRVEQPAGDGQFLLHAAGKLAGQGVLFAGDLQLFQQLVGHRLVVLHLVNPRGERQVLLHGQVIEQARLIREKRQLPLRRNRIGPKVMPANADAAARRRNNAREAAQGGGLARAIGPHQAHHLAGLNLEAEFVHRHELAVQLGQCFNLNHELRLAEMGLRLEAHRYGMVPNQQRSAEVAPVIDGQLSRAPPGSKARRGRRPCSLLPIAPLNWSLRGPLEAWSSGYHTRRTAPRPACSRLSAVPPSQSQKAALAPRAPGKHN